MYAPPLALPQNPADITLRRNVSSDDYSYGQFVRDAFDPDGPLYSLYAGSPLEHHGVTIEDAPALYVEELARQNAEIDAYNAAAQAAYDAWWASLPEVVRRFKLALGTYGPSVVGDAWRAGKIVIPADYVGLASDWLAKAQGEATTSAWDSWGYKAWVAAVSLISGGAASELLAATELATQTAAATQALQGAGELAELPALTTSTVTIADAAAPAAIVDTTAAPAFVDVIEQPAFVDQVYLDAADQAGGLVQEYGTTETYTAAIAPPAPVVAPALDVVTENVIGAKSAVSEATVVDATEQATYLDAADQAGGLVEEYGTTEAYSAAIAPPAPVVATPPAAATEATVVDTSSQATYLDAADQAGGLVQEYGTTEAYTAAIQAPAAAAGASLVDQALAAAKGVASSTAVKTATAALTGALKNALSPAKPASSAPAQGASASSSSSSAAAPLVVLGLLGALAWATR